MAKHQIQPQDISELENFRKTYLPRVAPGKAMRGAAIFCAFMSVVEVITAINKYLKPPSTTLSDRFRQDAILIASILAAVFFLLTILLSALYYAHRKFRVDLYDKGLIVITWRGSTSILWDDIYDLQATPIYGRSRQPVNWDYKITTDYDETIHLRGVDGVRSLGQYIERKIS